MLRYWQTSLDKLYSELGADSSGLGSSTVLDNRLKYGENKIQTKKSHHLIVEFLKQFKDPLIIILLIASLISAALGQIVNLVIISFMVTLSVIIDFYQEYQAESTAEKLRLKVSLTASVLRDGKIVDVPASEVVVGDIIQISSGDIIPADARIIKTKDLLVNQSSLTGESYPQEKTSVSIDISDPEITQLTNILFHSTSVIQGEALAVVVAVGKNTKFGQLAGEITKERSSNNFELGVKKFGFLLMKVTFAMVIFVFFFNSLFRHNVLDSFLFALALAVGLTPELLPVVITVNLSRGASRMSKKGVIVKKLSSIENLGGMQVLCTDKTGTLTEDEIRLELYEDIHQKGNQKVLLLGHLNSKFQAGLRNPLEKAILKHTEVDSSDYTKVDEIPFDFIRRRLSVVVKKGSELKLISKGAPESFIPTVTHYEVGNRRFKLTTAIKKKISDRFKKLSQDGYRVLAVGYKKVSAKKEFNVSDESGLTIIGLMAFLDPPKSDVKQTLIDFQKQGIEVKILTGDNELVTQKICSDIGLIVKGVILGDQLANLDQSSLLVIAKNNTIFARLSPDQKESIIRALRSDNLTVGYLGDGINDAPSLRAADVGISVNNAVDVAKDVADMILLQKDLHILNEGIYEGRKTFANVMKYIMMGTSSNFGNMFSVAAGSVFLPFLPMLPTQILLNNFLYDLSQIFLSGDRVDRIAITKPVKWDIGFIKKFMVCFGPISSIFDFATYALMLHYFKASQSLFQTGWFVESLVSQTLIIFAIRTQMVPFFKSPPSRSLFFSAVGIVSFCLIMPLTPLAHIFGFDHLPAQYFVILAGMIVTYFFIVERMKVWFYQHVS